MPYSSERALILASVGRDAALAEAILAEAKIKALPCKTMPDLVTELRKGAGFAVVAEEAFRGADLLNLSAFLKRQPEWSDFQFILLTFRGGGLERNPAAARLLDVLGNVTFLERPFHPTTLVSLAQAALRGRRRQYEARNRLIAIHESEERLRIASEAAHIGIWDYDLTTNELRWDERTRALFGLSPDASVSYDVFLAGLHPDDRDATHAAAQQALEPTGKGAYDIEYRAVGLENGITRWVHAKGKSYFEKGQAVRFIGTALDITERKRNEEHVQLLLSEVNHRSKNMLSLVQAIAKLTASPGAEDFVQRFGDRIRSLSAAQDLLIKHEWKAVPLADLIRLQLSHFADLIGGRIALSGPALSISQAASQGLSMALHELATNAAKYGALSNESGSIAIGWDIKATGVAEPKFTLSWVERGGPPVAKPQRRGFGWKVTTKMVESSVGGEVSVDYAPSGLVWHLECPAGNIVDGRLPLPVAGKPRVHAASGRRVLVVEDEPLIAAEIAGILELAGFDVVGPASGVREALMLLEHEGCDTAVVDVILGAETSEPIMRELVSIGTPFVVVSGYSREQLPLFFRSAPLIRKPFQAAELHAEINRCLVGTSAMS